MNQGCLLFVTTLLFAAKAFAHGDGIVLAVRDHVHPGAQRGPDSALIVPSRVLLLVRP